MLRPRVEQAAVRTRQDLCSAACTNGVVPCTKRKVEEVAAFSQQEHLLPRISTTDSSGQTRRGWGRVVDLCGLPDVPQRTLQGSELPASSECPVYT